MNISSFFLTLNTGAWFTLSTDAKTLKFTPNQAVQWRLYTAQSGTQLASGNVVANTAANINLSSYSGGKCILLNATSGYNTTFTNLIIEPK